MTGLSESDAGASGSTAHRLAELEADNARLRAALAERELQIDQLDSSRVREEQIRLVADSLPVLISYVDAGNRYRFNNKAYEAWFGHDRESLNGRHLRDVLGEAAYSSLKPLVDKALSGERVSIDSEVPYRDGGTRHVHIEYVPDRGPDGRIAGYFALVQDISERTRNEQALRESEARFRAMADSVPAPVWVTNETGIEFVNKAFVEVAGLPAEGLTGAVWMEIIHRDDLAQVLETRDRAWAERTGYAYEARFKRADGEWRWMQVTCKPRLDGRGALIGYVGMAVDFTEQRRAESELRESEARFRAIADSAPAPVWVTNEEGIEFANQGLIEFTGLSGEELLGTAWIGLIHPDDLPSVQRRRDAAWVERAPYEFEARFRRSDGEWRWLHCSCKPRQSQAGFLGYVGLAIDVTEARRAEEEMRDSEARLRLANQAAAIGTWDFRPVTGELRWDDRCRELFGLSPGTPVDYPTFLAGVHPADREGTDAAVQRALDPAGSGTFDIEYRTIGLEDGVERWLSAAGRALFEGGQAVRFIGTLIDISERKRANQALIDKEEALREETRLLETLNAVGASTSGELDLDRLVQRVTDAGVELTGAQFGAFFYNKVDEAGESYMLYTISGVERSEFDKFPMPRNTAVFHPTFSGEGVVRSDDIKQDPRYGHTGPHYGMPKGHLPVTSYLAVPVTSRSGEVVGGLFFGHAEPARFTERHERLLVGIAGQAAVAIDNARLYEAAQRELDERRRAQDALRDLNHSLETRIEAAIAERERAEEALRQAHKMEAVGQLTGGIAHDFNNLLTVITGNIDAARRYAGPSAEARLTRALGNALVGADRAAVLTQRLLAFSRRQPLSPRPIDPNKLVSGMSELLHRTLGETIAVETVLAAGLWRIEADSHQLENAILNLAVNARDAMPSGGTLTIETANTDLDRDPKGQNAEISPGQYVLIRVSDTGVGMDEDTLARAIEPFFTTKEVGRGTGLGLSMIYGFVKQSGGHLRIESAEGEGTNVCIYLPRLVGGEAAEEESDEPAIPAGTGDETILVCEDDDDVRAYTVEVLRELGYRVLEAHDGPSALRLLERQEGRVDLLFTDVVLPSGMTGNILAGEARAIRPELKVLFTTGYARDAIVHGGRLDPGVELITKPFAYAELAARVREMLDR